MAMRTCRYWARMAICAIAIGCHGGLSLDASSDLTDDGFEAIRRRLAITIESGPTGFTQIGSCSTTDCSPEAFRVAIRDTHCEACRRPCESGSFWPGSQKADLEVTVG